MQNRPVKNSSGHRISGICQTSHKPFHPPGGLALARMLTPDGPAHSLSISRRANRQQIEIGTIDRLPQHGMTYSRRSETVRKEIAQAFARIGRKISVVYGVPLRRMTNCHNTIPIFCRCAKPNLPVIGSNGLIFLPAPRVACLTGIFYPEGAFNAADASSAKMKPLEEIGIRIFTNRQADRCRIARIDYLYISGVKMVADMHACLTPSKRV